MSNKKTLDLDCCGETQPTNPITDVFNRKADVRPMSFFDIKNPILVEVSDSKEMGSFFKNFPFYPYGGTNLESSHSLLSFYKMLAKLSPTHGACMAKKTNYAVGGRVKIVNALDPVWNIPIDSAPVPVATQLRYRDAVNSSFMFDGGLQSIHETISNYYQSVGEAYVELTYTTVLGVTKINVKVHKETHVLPIKTETSYNVFGVSAKWTEDYLKKNPARLVPQYPEFVDNEGVISTMFFLKSGDGVRHGRPESQSSDLYKYREVQDSNYLIKQAAGNFSGQLIIEVEDADPTTNPIDNEGASAAGFNDFAGQFESNFTNKSQQPQSVLITNRPHGAGEMFVFQIKPNTAENWYEVTGDLAVGYITRSHSVTPRFIGKESSNGFSENAYLLDYLTNVEPTINTLREKVTDFTNEIINAGWNILGAQEMKQMSISFDNPIQSMIDLWKQQQQSKNDNSVRGTEI